MSWRRWGNPELDAGADLTVADLMAHDGYVPYEDVRYFYGPAGIYCLGLAFKLFGSSFTVAYVFGYLQTGAILGAFYALARRWVQPLAATLATAVLAAIGFSGTLFNFVLPHTNSATFGLLFVLLELLALARGRSLLAGLAAGVAALTRPEFALVAAVALLAGAVGRWREGGWPAALREALVLFLPALAIAGTVLGGFALAVGADRLFFENLIPLDFTRVAGFRFQENWAPFTIESGVAMITRGALWILPVLALGLSLDGVRNGRGVQRILALWPLGAVVLGLAALDGLARLAGAFPGTRSVVEDEVLRLLIPMSWLPLAALAAGVWALIALRRDGAPPLGASWPADLALIAAGLALAVRAYNEFTTDIYATYYAAVPLLLATIGQERLADRWPAARPALRGAFAVAAAALAAHAYVGLYRDNNTEVNTARGGYLASDSAAPALQKTLDLVRAQTQPPDLLLALPDDPGIHFMTDRRPALYEITFLPGTLDSKADEREAITRLGKGRPPVVVIGARRFDQYGLPTIGKDFNRDLMNFVRAHYVVEANFGDVDDPPRNSMPSEAFTVLGLD
jgi:Dolichyl-phosphate-mannose-protein mannosyltransferase